MTTFLVKSINDSKLLKLRVVLLSVSKPVVALFFDLAFNLLSVHFFWLKYEWYYLTNFLEIIWSATTTRSSTVVKLIFLIQRQHMKTVRLLAQNKSFFVP